MERTGVLLRIRFYRLWRNRFVSVFLVRRIQAEVDSMWLSEIGTHQCPSRCFMIIFLSKNKFWLIQRFGRFWWVHCLWYRVISPESSLCGWGSFFISSEIGVCPVALESVAIGSTTCEFPLERPSPVQVPTCQFRRATVRRGQSECPCKQLRACVRVCEN